MSVGGRIGFWGVFGILALMQLASPPIASSDPAWLTSSIYDEYAQADRVPLPWMPVMVGENSVHVWGRSASWGSSSILPSSILTQGTELLKNPMRLVVTIGGTDYTVPLSSFTVTEQKLKRVTMVAQGSTQSIDVTANMTMDYDGFLWVKLTLNDGVVGRQVSKLLVVAELDKQYMKVFQTFGGQTDTSDMSDMYGFIGTTPIQIKWNPKGSIVDFYHWFGNPDMGVGFTYTTLKNWKPVTRNNFATLIPGSTAQTYRMNLIESSTALNGQVFEFGVQATPIKPLPPDYHSWMTSRIAYQSYKAWNRIPQNIDCVLAFQPSLMPGLNAPYKVSQSYDAYVNWAHGKGIGITTLPSCPQRFSSQSDEFTTYFDDWKALPTNILTWPDSSGVDQYLNCGKSETLRKWNFYGWAVENADRFGTEGIYFDGWMAGQMGCNNPAHDHGWDDGGVRQLEVPVLEGREFNHVMALYLQDNVNSPYYAPPVAPERPGFPKYHYWIHSWSFVPPVMGHATMWLTGEEAGYKDGGTFSGKTLGEVYGLAGLYAKCLSTNWGVPNVFYPCIWEAGDPADWETTEHQTLSMFAWLLPHGIPIGPVDYMNADRVVEIGQIMMGFDTRRAEFTPAWRTNPYLEITTPISDEVVVATWAHPIKRKVLAVVSNLKVDSWESIELHWKGFDNARVRNARTGDPIEMENGTFSLFLENESFVLLSIDSQDSGLLPGDSGFLVPWRNSNKVSIYDSDWNALGNFVTFQNFEQPSAVAYDKTTGDVYVAVTTDVSSYVGGAVLKYDNQGNLISEWSVQGLGYITGLAVRDDGKVFVCDQNNQTLTWYSTSDSSTSGSLSSSPDAMGPLGDLDIDSAGNLIVSAGTTVKRWNADLTYYGILVNTDKALDVKIMPDTGALRVLRWDNYVLGYAADGTWTGPYYYTPTSNTYAQALWIDPAATAEAGRYYRAATRSNSPYGGIQRGVYYDGSYYWQTVVSEGSASGGWYPRDIEPFVAKGPKLDVNVTLQDYKGDLSLVAIKVDVLRDGFLTASKTVTPTAATSTVSFGLQPGSYVVRTSATQWLAKEQSVNVSEDTSISVPLSNGDIDGNNQIGAMDFLILKNSFDKASE